MRVQLLYEYHGYDRELFHTVTALLMQIFPSSAAIFTASPLFMRDAIIIFCLDHGYTLMRTDEELFRFGEETIS